MPRSKERPSTDEGHFVEKQEVTEQEFLEFCFKMRDFYLSQAQNISNTLEQLELNTQLGKYTHFFKDKEGNYSFISKDRPKLGFKHD